MLVMTPDLGNDDDRPDAVGRDLWYPVVVCDHCGRRIATAATGLAVWPADRPGEGDRDLTYCHLTCFPGYARSHRGRGDLVSHGLSHLIGGLVAVLGGDPDTAIATAATLARTETKPSTGIPTPHLAKGAPTPDDPDDH